MHDLVVVNMANAVREISVGKGHDPREFLFLAYGGTLPLFASQIAERLGIGTIVIPRNSSVFCAMGLLASDYMMRFDQAVGMDLSQAAGMERVNDVFAEMTADATAAMQAEGFVPGDIRVHRTADMRFQGQAYELTLPMPDRPLAAGDPERLAEEFRVLYERTYGEGTAWKGVPVINCSVTVVGLQPEVDGAAAPRADSGDATPRTRRVFQPAKQAWDEIPIYDDRTLAFGAQIDGPAIVDAQDTTIYVPPGTRATRDELLNYVLTR
jgi:N-methylhydantoinase A